MTKLLPNHKGTKGGAGVHQTIINHMPPHLVYIEGCLGRGEIMQRKKPAKYNIGVDIDRTVIKAWKDNKAQFPNILVFRYDSIGAVSSFNIKKDFELSLKLWLFERGLTLNDVLIYFDLPYLISSRMQKRKLYRHELSERGHALFLQGAMQLPVKTIISTYPNKLYYDYLGGKGHKVDGWNYHDFRTRTRGRTVTERIYFNYDKPTSLHDYRYVGKNFRDRERIKNKITRKVNSLKRLSKSNPLEFNAVMDALKNQIV